MSSQTETEEVPLTRCTNCHTVFEVAQELLASTDTRVRCGECLCIFDAMDGLRGADENNDTLGQQWLDDTHNDGLLSDAGDLSAAHEALADEVENMAAEQANAVLSVAAESEDTNTLAASTLENAGAAALAGLSNDTQALDVTYSDFDLFSEDAELPEIAYFDQTRDTPEFNFDSVELDEDETFSDTLFSNDVTINADLPITGEKPDDSTPLSKPADVDYIADRVPKEPLIFNYERSDAKVTAEGVSETTRSVNEDADYDGASVGANSSSLDSTTVSEALDNAPASPSSSWTMRIGLSVLVLSVLVGLYAYRERARFANNPMFRSIVNVSCEYLSCAKTVVSDPKLFTYAWRMYSHPTKEGVLVLSGPMRNNGNEELGFPSLTIKFQNRVGATIRQLQLDPADYVNNWDASATLLSGKHIDFSLEVNDPGHLIYSFEVM
ncbi:MAG: DUF3426 domain-containing protein [Gammaproteobacteria bacterium]|nr:DUF3426 domain-containing protein [Gammaproteobacteria bacterium]